jgi:uncharacterized protein (TIGR00661 family)
VASYDLIINDFESVTAWSCYLKNKKCVALSNQYALFSDKGPKLKKRSHTTLKMLRYFAPVFHGYGLHFKRFDDTIFLPIIRKKIRGLNVNDLGYFLVYLPSYGKEAIQNVLVTFPKTNWVVFFQKLKPHS